jgi:hypothetical protein
MFVICSIALAINGGGINFLVKEDTEGRILKESETKYLVDFSEGVTKFKLAGKPEDYNKVLVDKTECIKE